MTRNEIISAIEELIDLTHCSEPAEDVVQSAVAEGVRVIEALQHAARVEIVPEDQTGYPGEQL